MANCKGCYTKTYNPSFSTSYYDSYPCYHVNNEKYQRKCPCNICVIKVVCYEPCEEYAKHWKPLDKTTLVMGVNRSK